MIKPSAGGRDEPCKVMDFCVSFQKFLVENYFTYDIPPSGDGG